MIPERRGVFCPRRRKEIRLQKFVLKKRLRPPRERTAETRRSWDRPLVVCRKPILL